MFSRRAALALNWCRGARLAALGTRPETRTISPTTAAGALQPNRSRMLEGSAAATSVLLLSRPPEDCDEAHVDDHRGERRPREF